MCSKLWLAWLKFFPLPYFEIEYHPFQSLRLGGVALFLRNLARELFRISRERNRFLIRKKERRGRILEGIVVDKYWWRSGTIPPIMILRENVDSDIVRSKLINFNFNKNRVSFHTPIESMNCRSNFLQKSSPRNIPPRSRTNPSSFNIDITFVISRRESNLAVKKRKKTLFLRSNYEFLGKEQYSFEAETRNAPAQEYRW